MEPSLVSQCFVERMDQVLLVVAALGALAQCKRGDQKIWLLFRPRPSAPHRRSVDVLPIVLKVVLVSRTKGLSIGAWASSHRLRRREDWAGRCNG